MAVFSGTIRSQTLAMDTGLQVILPYDRPAENQQTPCKVLYLLHGLGDNCAAWCRYTAIERYARQYGLAVVMPEVQRSFYQDMKFGISYFTYITRELPQLCGEMFRISTRREDTFVAGLSMGGYGALRCALVHPQQYAGAASFSGALDLHYLSAHHASEKNAAEFQGIFGMDLQVEEDMDLCRLAEQVARLPRAEQPRLLTTCGKQDFLFDMNVQVQEHFSSLPLDYRWECWDSAHEWPFWDTSVKLALDHFLGNA